MARLAPVSRLKKDELIWLSAHRCKHHHTYLEHYSCYLDENPERGTIGFLDIETSNLDANFGIIYSYCIKDGHSDNILGRVITKKELFSDGMDKKLVSECVADMLKFDHIVTFYGTRFDMPFVRSRAIYNGLDFPPYGEILHTDIYFTVRNKFKLNSNRLKTACAFLLGNTNKTEINFLHWIHAMQGRKDSLEYIFEHNKYDVIDLERLYKKIIPFKKRLDQSA